jgi:ribonuclease J
MSAPPNVIAPPSRSRRSEDGPPPGRLRVVPLGGLGEFGKNMMAFEWESDLILVDCGQMFPEDDMLGVDAVIPDFDYIATRREKLRGLILTHGHEDHIGAVPYFARDFDAPIHGSRLTLELVRGKLREMDVEIKGRLREVDESEPLQLGAFRIEFIPVAHSIPEAFALAIATPIGTVVHTGDYKFDGPGGAEAFARFEGAALLMGDSTNVGREGRSPTESVVAEALDPILRDCSGAVVLATFASGLHRVQTALDMAARHGRKVFVVGRGLERNYEIALRLGLLRCKEGLVLPIREADRFRASQRLVLVTGSQGEPESALSRMALDGLKAYRLGPNDTVVFSARMIPGNERQIYRTINHIYKRGARVVTEREARVLYRRVRPRFFAPIHGELRQLIDNGEVAVESGIDPGGVFIMENGDALELDGERAELRRLGLAGQVLVDGKVLDEVEEVVLRDRKHLAEDGMVIVILVIERKTHEIVAGPDIVTRGFVEVDRSEGLIQACRQVVIDAFEDCDLEGKEEWDVVNAAVRKALRRFLKKETDRYPVILPVVMEI